MWGIKKASIHSSISYLLVFIFATNPFFQLFFWTKVFWSNLEDKKILSLNKDHLDYNPENIIVKFKKNSYNKNSTLNSLKNNVSWVNIEKIDFFEKSNIWIIKLNNSKKEELENYIKKMNTLAEVEYAELDYARNIKYTWVDTNDTDSINQRYLKSIQADDAWKIYNDNQDKITVSINDTGVDYTHSDLVWNLKDLSSNCLSDTWLTISCPNYGYNFEWDWNYNSLTAVLPENETYDINWHWTHVTWTIWAVWYNNSWVIWVTQNVEMISSRIETYEQDYNVFYVSNTIRALNFAIENWAKVINASYGWTSYSSAEYNALSLARDAGVLFIAAAWNSANNNDLATKFYPSSYDLDNIISVASVWNDDTLAYYSSFWPNSVDLAAPWGDMSKDPWILSTTTYYENIWNHNMNSFSWITLSWTGLSWNLLWNDIIETSSGAYNWLSSYTWSENKTLSFDQTIDLTWAKFAKFEWHIECNLSTWDNLELILGNEVIWNAYPYWDYSRWYYLWNLSIPIPSNLYTSWLELKLRFTSNNDTDVGYWCGFDDFKILKYSDNKSAYQYLQGTSMATPVVTWVASMIWSYKPDLTYSEVKDIILSSVDIIPALWSKVLTSWKLNAKNAIKELISRYWITKNWTFEWETFNAPLINLDWKNITLSGSTINLTSTWNIFSLSWSTISWTWLILVWTWKILKNWTNTFSSTTSDFDILFKKSLSWAILGEWEIVIWDKLVIDYSWTLVWNNNYIKIDSWVTNLYDWVLSKDLVLNISESFSWSIDTYVYKNWDYYNWVSTGVILEILDKKIINNIDFTYEPPVFTWSINFDSVITNNTSVNVNLTSSYYPVSYSITWDITSTLTGTLNNSWSILVELNSWDWDKSLSVTFENINSELSPIYNNTVKLDTTPAIVSIISNQNNDYTSTGTITLTWSVSDINGVSDFVIDGESISITNWNWNKNLFLTWGLNTINYNSLDLAWNIWTWSINLIRVPVVTNLEEIYIWTWSMQINFNTDLSSTWVIMYWTWINDLNSSFVFNTSWINHNILLPILPEDITYYYKVKGIYDWYDGDYSQTWSFLLSKDITPNSFNFTDINSANLSSAYISNQIEISWVNTWSLISIAGWSYRINWGSWITTWNLVNNWDKLEVMLTSSSLYNTTVNLTLSIWNFSDIYSVKTKAQVVSSGWWGWGGWWGWVWSIWANTVKTSIINNSSNESDNKINSNVDTISKQNSNFSVKSSFWKSIYNKYYSSLEKYDNYLENLSYLWSNLDPIKNDFRNKYANLCNSLSKVDDHVIKKENKKAVLEYQKTEALYSDLNKYLDKNKVKSINIRDEKLLYFEYKNKKINKVQDLLLLELKKKNFDKKTFETFNIFIFSINNLIENKSIMSKSEKNTEIKKIKLLYQIFISKYNNLEKK